LTAATGLHIVVNGEPLELSSATTVADLLDRLRVAIPRVAVERNLEIVPKGRFADTVLEEGDRVEIVQFVGGG
jgi:thiamine biosynthesis protein ThiS